MQLTKSEKEQLRIQLDKMIERYGIVNVKQTIHHITLEGRSELP